MSAKRDNTDLPESWRRDDPLGMDRIEKLEYLAIIGRETCDGLIPPATDEEREIFQNIKDEIERDKKEGKKVVYDIPSY